MNNQFEPSGFGKTVFDLKYPSFEGETWRQCAVRVIEDVCKSETPEIRQRMLEIMSPGKFFPGGRTIYGAGRDGWLGNLLNCFIFELQDTKESIGGNIRDMYITSCHGGGVGYTLKNIRPRGSAIGANKVASPGIVSVAKMIDAVGGEVRTGNSRRAAILGAAPIRHPDVLEWIRIKQDTKNITKHNLGTLSNHNISIHINNQFIERVENGMEWEFEFNGIKWPAYLVQRNHDKEDEFIVPALDKQHALDICNAYYKHEASDSFVVLRHYPIKSKWLWDKIMDSNLRCAEPGLLNESVIRENYAVEHIEPFSNCNPCSEALTGHMGNCTLGSINLTKYVDNGNVLWDELRADIAENVRFLDNVLTVNKYPIDEQRVAAHKIRRVGLGVMGYGHMLIDLGMRYGRSDALEFTAKLAEFIRNSAFRASVELAKEKGPCPAIFGNSEDTEIYLSNAFIKRLPEDIREDIRHHGIRNAVLLSIAPTGSIGSVAGVSTSIEPIFAPAYKRRYRRGEHWDEEIVFDPKFKEMYLSGKHSENVVGAYDVTPEEHMATLATWQDYIDQSISKTINCPAGTKLSDFSQALFKYIHRIKGVSTYLQGSRGFEPLEPISVEDAIRLIQEEENIRTQSFVQDCATGACEI